jgi:hypothetical protein
MKTKQPKRRKNPRKATPDNQTLMQKAIKWWHKTFPRCELRPSVNCSAMMHGKRDSEWGTGSKVEGPYVLLRSHDGGQAFPLHDLTICGLFRWNGRKLVPILIIDGHADEYTEESV